MQNINESELLVKLRYHEMTQIFKYKFFINAISFRFSAVAVPLNQASFQEGQNTGGGGGGGGWGGGKVSKAHFQYQTCNENDNAVSL